MKRFFKALLVHSLVIMISGTIYASFWNSYSKSVFFVFIVAGAAVVLYILSGTIFFKVNIEEDSRGLAFLLFFEYSNRIFQTEFRANILHLQSSFCILFDWVMDWQSAIESILIIFATSFLILIGGLLRL